MFTEEYKEGQEAWKVGIPDYKNPYPEGSQESDDWFKGWWWEEDESHK